MSDVMRIQHGRHIKSMPMSLLRPNEYWADHNHGQSLDKLHSRGGVDPTEFMAIYKGVRYRELGMTPDECIAEMDKMASPESVRSEGSVWTMVHLNSAEGPVLDWMVAKCEGRKVFITRGSEYGHANCRWAVIGSTGHQYDPHRGFAQAAPILDKNDIYVDTRRGYITGIAGPNGDHRFISDNRVVAMLKAYVLWKSDYILDVPAVLLKDASDQSIQIPDEFLSPWELERRKSVGVTQVIATTHSTMKEVSKSPEKPAIHCKQMQKPGGCQLHNLHCGYPKCNQSPEVK